MLSMRAKPPPEREFEDIFQKFKLSFNLLAKLKAHIHDPNAPELVHFLFTPLALIVDASHDSHYGPNLPSKVLAPLLNKNAVDLLINCLTSKVNIRELSTNLREVSQCSEKAPTRAFFLLKVRTSCIKALCC